MNDHPITLSITLPVCWQRLIAVPSIAALPAEQRGGRVAPTADDPKAYWRDYRAVEALVETPGGPLKVAVALDSKDDRYITGYVITTGDDQPVATHYDPFTSFDFLEAPITGADGRRYQLAVTWSPADPVGK